MQICTARGEASLAADWSPVAPGTANAGSMSRPGEELVQDVEVVACVDFVTGQHAILAVDFKDGDRDHQVAGELEGVGLSKGAGLNC